jgi:hypothetical protein
MAVQGIDPESVLGLLAQSPVRSVLVDIAGLMEMAELSALDHGQAFGAGGSGAVEKGDAGELG